MGNFQFRKTILLNALGMDYQFHTQGCTNSADGIEARLCIGRKAL